MELLKELHTAPLDEAGRHRLRGIYETTIRDLEATLSPSLAAELHRFSSPLAAEGASSEADARVAQAQLVGWLAGLLHMMEAAVITEQLEGLLQRPDKAASETVEGESESPSNRYL